MNRKEYGSNFHYPIDEQWYLSDPKMSFFGENSAASLFVSGRSALYHLLEMGIEEEAWKRVYLPSYYCHEVSSFIKDLPIDVQFYPFDPTQDSRIDPAVVPDESDVVLVVVSFFGMPEADTSSHTNVTVVADLSHALTRMHYSEAHYCFGSLRKELPVPLGGFCYSPKKLKLPTAEHTMLAVSVSLQKEDVMLQLGSYLRGETEEKNLCRALFAQTEQDLEKTEMRAALPENSSIWLRQLHMEAILYRKQQNLHYLIQELKEVLGSRIVQNSGNYPSFGLLLRCHSKLERDALKFKLVESKIFPAILWPDQTQPEDMALMDQLLFIHADFRYDSNSLAYVVQVLKDFYS